MELREVTSESRIREALRSLEKTRVLNTDYKRGRPRKAIESVNGLQKGRYEHKIRSRNYKISLELDIFKRVFAIFDEEGSDVFFKSNYVNKMIEIYTLGEIYKQLEEKFKNHYFNATSL